MSKVLDKLSDSLSRKRVVLALVLTLLVVAGVFWWQKDETDVETLFQRAELAAQNGQPQLALPLLDQVLQQEPGHHKALLYRGQITLQQGDADSAIEYFRQVKDEPRREAGTARYLQGTAWYAKREARKTEESFLQAIERHPTYLQPRESLIRLYSIQHRPVQLRKQLLEIRRIRTWNLEELFAYQLADSEASRALENISILEEFIAADPEDVNSQIALALHYLTHRRLQDAVTLLETSLKHFPNNLNLKAVMVEVYVEQLDLQAARHLLQTDLLKSESPVSWWRVHGLYAFETKNWQEAITCLKRATAASPNDFSAAYMLGIAFQRTGKTRQAEEQLKRAQLTEQLSVAASSLLRGDRNRTDLMSRFVLKTGRLLLELGRTDDAGPWLETVLAWQPRHQEAQSLLRRAVAQAKQPETADRQQADEELTEQSLSDIRDITQSTRKEKTHSPATTSTIRLRDDHASAGIDFQYFNGQSQEKYLLDTVGGGVAVIDYDRNGWPDLFFPNGSRIDEQQKPTGHADQFYRNLGDAVYENVTTPAGLESPQFGQGCIAADYNNDGFPDLLVANFGSLLVYHNQGDGTFVEVAQQIGITGTRWSASLGMSDLDRDGDLDLYVANYLQNPLLTCRDSEGRPATCSPGNFAGEQDLLFLNHGDGRFSDITESSGIQIPNGKGLGVVIADFDNDHWPDIYVANDGEQNFLFQNRTAKNQTAEPTFTEVGLISGTAMSSDGRAQAGMGVACADFDHDGGLDLYVTNFFQDTNTLYLNRERLSFSDETQAARLAKPTFNTLGFGTQAVDLDLDGHHEIMVANGHIDDRRFEGTPWQMPPHLFRPHTDGTYEEVSEQTGPYFRGKYLGRAVARLDFNRDALPDLVVVHQDRPAALLSNQTTNPGHVLRLELYGVKSNRDAIGTRVHVTANSMIQTFEITGGDGFYASNERTLLIGLGPARQIEKLEILWPSGHVDLLSNLSSDIRILLIESSTPLIDPIPERP